METHLADWLKGTSHGNEAEAILRSCVHCGFCTATCPTYQLLGDELDGPRGRIYLMKQVMEGAEPSMSTMTHLDRCLTCLNCETTCPSGVRYGRLVDIGRGIVESKVRRPLAQRMLRQALKEGLTRRWLFDPAMRIGKRMRGLLPGALRSKVPPRRDPGAWPARTHERKVLLLNGCVQPAMMPNIDAATARVLDRLGVQAIVDRSSGCCGAIRHHLNDHDGALADARRNIDAWWPRLQSGVEAIVINASGCGAMVKSYGQLLREDPAYAAKAAAVSKATVDIAEWLPSRIEALKPRLRSPAANAPRVAFHAPCTLQHGQQVRGMVERLLADLGVALTPVPDSHLCCGSAGTYSVLQPELAFPLRDRKLSALQSGAPQRILSANIGCITHLQSGTETPVQHWIEWLDEATNRAPAGANSDRAAT
ncbi:MAG TPA: glycolate oxidase subunit GlcF [Burkholderiaceae bacterium]|nr:glycolate oxidase subunit GlcF [Burkholderiaceae bacterium]